MTDQLADALRGLLKVYDCLTDDGQQPLTPIVYGAEPIAAAREALAAYDSERKRLREARSSRDDPHWLAVHSDWLKSQREFGRASRIDMIRERLEDAERSTPTAPAGGETPIDDDIFEDDGRKQCISGFGEHAIAHLVRHYEINAERNTAEWYINVLVRWCRNFNGKLQRQAATLRAAEAVRAENERLKETIAIRTLDRDCQIDAAARLTAELTAARAEADRQWEETARVIERAETAGCIHCREFSKELRAAIGGKEGEGV